MAGLARHDYDPPMADWWNPLAMLRRADCLLNRGEKLMAKFDVAIAALNEATNAVAAEIDELRTGGTIENAETNAKLMTISARLQSLAADPADPVPAEPPPVEPVV